jgi:hypothetical protein
MKSKKVLAILLSLAIMLTFMPTMAFAATGDADDVTCVYTVAGTTQTQETNSIDDAIDAVNDGGSIVVTGTINQQHVINVEDAAFTVDASGATINEGGGFAAGEGRCLVAEDKVYSYHPAHDYNKADAVAKDDQFGYAYVTLYCKNGDSVLLPEPVQYEDFYETETKVFFYATVEVADDEFGVEWNVDKEKIKTTYELTEESPMWIEDRTGLAILGEDGKVQFYANYYIVKGLSKELAVDDNGDPIKLEGTITKATVSKKSH